jgi:small subunit ribosomal protein S2
MPKTSFEDLLEAGVHFGHLKRKWNPNMAPYIFSEKKGIHVIDLNKTIVKLEDAANAMKQIAKSGRKILFVATKKQAKDIVAEKVKEINMPYVTERWSGGMLTNFATIRKAIKKMSQIDKMEADGTLMHLSKRERLQISRQRAKLEKNLGSISELTRIPSAIFIVDVLKEKIAVAEANKLGITTIAVVDTNSDPSLIDFPIPANDDATKSIALIMNVIINAVAEGLAERKNDREKQKQTKAKKSTAEAKKSESNEVAEKVEEKTTEKKEEAPKAKATKAKKPAKSEKENV